MYTVICYRDNGETGEYCRGTYMLDNRWDSDFQICKATYLSELAIDIARMISQYPEAHYTFLVLEDGDRLPNDENIGIGLKEESVYICYPEYCPDEDYKRKKELQVELRSMIKKLLAEYKQQQDDNRKRAEELAKQQQVLEKQHADRKLYEMLKAQFEGVQRTPGDK